MIVSGAARGIGKTTSRQFAEEGAAVWMSDISEDVVAAAEEIAAATGGEVRGMVSDITDPASCEELVLACTTAHGRLDATAVTAGVLQDIVPVHELEPEEWDRVMAINAKGPFLMARASIPAMRETGGGRFVVVSSWFGQAGHAFFAAYGASKGAVRTLVQVIADEYARDGITANAVAPGNINTELHRNALADEARERGVPFEEVRDIEWGKIPLGRAGEPEDIGSAILFLASEEAKYVTGACLDVNGGCLYR